MTAEIEIMLIRHGEVQLQWKKTCYGSMDVALSQSGQQQSIQLAKHLCSIIRPQMIFHSGLSRTRFLANEIARLSNGGVCVCEDLRLAERNYGDWQGQSWDDAYASDPLHFHDLIAQPDSYRPPSGETTSEMKTRVVDWLTGLIPGLEQMPRLNSGPIIAVSHSGPIAALCGHLLNLHPTEWAPWMIRPLEAIRVRVKYHNTTICSLSQISGTVFGADFNVSATSALTGATSVSQAPKVANKHTAPARVQ